MSAENKTVYVVIYGDYSSQSIEGVFTEQEQADAFALELHKTGRSSRVEEFALNEKVGLIAYPQFSAEIDLKTGEVRKTQELLGSIGRNDQAYAFGDAGFANAFSSRSQEHAIKLAYEARQAWLRKQTEPTPTTEGSSNG